MLAAVVFWIVCAIGAAAIAGSKGRSGVKGFFAGLVLGPIGVLIALGLPDAQRKAELEARSGPDLSLALELRPCPMCAERIQRAALRCRFCGADVAPAPRVLNADSAKA